MASGKRTWPAWPAGIRTTEDLKVTRGWDSPAAEGTAEPLLSAPPKVTVDTLSKPSPTAKRKKRRSGLLGDGTTALMYNESYLNL
jgi:hypothetical protein